MIKATCGKKPPRRKAGEAQRFAEAVKAAALRRDGKIKVNNVIFFQPSEGRKSKI